MTKTPTLALLGAMLLASLAGCADNGPAEPQSDDGAGTPDELERQLGAAPGNATGRPAVLDLDTPFLLSAQAGPDSPISAFLWTVPKGAIIEYQPIPDIPDFVIEELVFGLVPVFPAGNVTLEEFSLLVFRIDDEAELAASYIGVPMSGVFSDVLTTTPIEGSPELDPAWLFLGAGGLEEGDTLAFVFTGKSAEPTPVGLLLSPQAKQPEASPAADADELLDGRIPVSLPMSGSGAGFQFAFYFNFNLMFLTSVFHQEVRTSAVTVEDRLRAPTEPVATARDATVSASYGGGGFTMAFAEEFAFGLLVPCTAAGKHDIQLDAHGTTVDHRSLIVETPAASGSLITGLPFAIAVGEGSSASSSMLDFQLASTCNLEIGLLQQMDLGATLAELTGTPAATGAAAFGGLVGSIPPSTMHARGGDLLLHGAHGTTQLAGLGHLLDPVEEARAAMAAA